MNRLPSQVKSFFEELKPLLPASKTCEAVIFAAGPLIPSVLRYTKDLHVSAGGQDVSAHEFGAYTGEVAAEMLSDLNVKYCIVGHSERRQYFGETDQQVNDKAHRLLRNGITPVICVGESLNHREQGLTMDVVNYQLKSALAAMDAAQTKKCVIAYEPLWAIGTGHTATVEQAEEVCAELREIIRKIHGARIARSVSILYGGSMNEKNCEELLSMPDIDGGLIGGASLKPQEFAKIIAATATE